MAYNVKGVKDFDFWNGGDKVLLNCCTVISQQFKWQFQRRAFFAKRSLIFIYGCS